MRISRVSPALAMLLLAVSAVVASGSDHAPVVTDRLKTTAAMSALPSDFNGDGVEDRVIGVPYDKTDRLYSSGGLHVLYSPGPGPDGTMPSSQYFTTQSPSMQKLLKMYPTGFGSTIASGDFDRDGYADVAVSVHGYDEPDESRQRINVGGIVVIYGTDHGLDVNGAQPARVWSQDSAGVQGVSEDDDAFGSSLVVGDFDGDQFLDLAIGIEGEQVGAKARQEGAVTVLYGARGGLTARDQIVDQDTRGILDAAETGDWAGHALAAADFNSDGVDDLALGVFSEGVDGKPNAGRGDRFVSQALDSIPGDADKNDWFGATLTVGDFNGDSSDDLVVGAPDDTVGGAEDSGSATYIPGSTSGLVLARSTFLALGQVSSGGGGAHFAAALAAGDVNGDGYDELAVSSPGRRVSRQLRRPHRHRRTDTDPGPARRTRTGPGLGVLRRCAPARPPGHAARRGPARRHGARQPQRGWDQDPVRCRGGDLQPWRCAGFVLAPALLPGRPRCSRNGGQVGGVRRGAARFGTVHTMRGPATSTPPGTDERARGVALSRLRSLGRARSQIWRA